MKSPIDAVIFRYVADKLTVLFPYVKQVGYMIGKVYIYPPVEDREINDLYLDDATGRFYIYRSSSDSWVKIDKRWVPQEIIAWCAATGRYVK